MAQRSITVLVDDLTGKDLDPDQAETVTFSLDGQQYELDTNSQSAARIRKALAPYVSAGRKVRPKTPRRSPSRTAVAPDSRTVRAWAASNGIELSDRGRIPASVLEKFTAAGN
jgi:hypothetical protein